MNAHPKRKVIIAAIAGCLFAIAPEARAQPDADDDVWFPWKKDRYWFYAGSVHYMDPSSEQPLRREITWVTRVEDVIETENWKVALVRGCRSTRRGSTNRLPPAPT